MKSKAHGALPQLSMLLVMFPLQVRGLWSYILVHLKISTFFFSLLYGWFWASSVLHCATVCAIEWNWKPKTFFTDIIAFKYWERWVHTFHSTDWCVYCWDCLLSLSSTRPENCLYLSEAQPNQEDPRGIQSNKKSNYDIEHMKTFLLKFSL